MDNWWLLVMVADYQRRDALREAKQERLIRAAEGPCKTRRSWTSVASMLSSLVSLVIRSQS